MDYFDISPSVTAPIILSHPSTIRGIRALSCGPLTRVSISLRSAPKSMGLVIKRLGAALQRFALGLRITIGGNHDHRDVGPNRLGLRQQFETGHPRHVDVGQNQDDGHSRRISNALKRHVVGSGKLHRETAGHRRTILKVDQRGTRDVRFGSLADKPSRTTMRP